MVCAKVQLIPVLLAGGQRCQLVWCNSVVQSLSIVVPAYNEASAIAMGKLTAAAEWLGALPRVTQLLVVDDGSEDDTAALAAATADKVVSIAHSGKAAAIVAGIGVASGDLVLVMDMDQATPVTEGDKLLVALDGPKDIAAGSRGLVRRGAPLSRCVVSWGHVALRRLLLGMALADTQCGFKAFSRMAALDILSSLRLYHPARMAPIRGPSVTSGFDCEFLFVASRLGYRIHEVPVIWNYEDTRRVNLARDAWHGARDLVRIAAGDMRGGYPARPASHNGSSGFS